MGLTNILQNNQIIVVKSIDTVFYRKRKTLLINGKIRLGQGSKILYICDKCGSQIEQMFKFRDRFLENKFICTECMVKENARINGGFNFQKNEFQNKYRLKRLEKYGDINYNNIEKSKKTRLLKYGDENYRNPQKAKQTNLKKYGYENFVNKEKIKQTNLNTYGSETYIQCKDMKEKTKKTNLKKYGYEYPMQNKEIFKKQMSSLGKSQKLIKLEENLHYQNQWELNFINFCKQKNINISDGPSINYVWNNKTHVYNIDFETDNYIVEIKGSHHWYFKDLENGRLDAKNTAAIKYSKSINKQFLFLLDVNNFSLYIKEGKIG